ncbi:hypothetical protein D7V97_00365 [Corallococcus sp. CA053C]|nr:hypothetical protein D7V97_00365 [Corallococcus sp. CA053C]
MSTQSYRRLVTKVFERLGMQPPADDWHGVDPVFPLLERMREEGAVVVMKLDGERRGPDDNGPYTVVVSGSPLAGSYLKAEMHSLEEALSKVILEYAVRCWGA